METVLNSNWLRIENFLFLFSIMLLSVCVSQKKSSDWPSRRLCLLYHAPFCQLTEFVVTTSKRPCAEPVESIVRWDPLTCDGGNRRKSIQSRCLAKCLRSSVALFHGRLHRKIENRRVLKNRTVV